MTKAGNIAFRVDASRVIGSGHVMRCLTLADALRERGYVCHFASRAHEGHLGQLIRERGHNLHLLSADATSQSVPFSHTGGSVGHAAWLNTTQERDAAELAPLLEELEPQWLIVDHYALDAVWEHALTHRAARLMVIDDLADRSHACHLLLDQTFGRDTADYASLVPADARVLCGSTYALLRPSFSGHRARSLRRRRRESGVKHIMISMGGVDADNLTTRVLDALSGTVLPEQSRVSVVLGLQTPWVDDVKRRAKSLPYSVELFVAVEDMAALMVDCDLAIGAAGATSWERCCLGVPTIMVVIADNQQFIAQNLSSAGAAELVSLGNLGSELPSAVEKIIKRPSLLSHMSERAAGVTDGNGVKRIISHMKSLEGIS